MAVSGEDISGEPEQAAGLLTVPEEGGVVFGGQGSSAVPLGNDVHEPQLIEEVYERLGDRGAFEVVTTEFDGVKTLHVLGDADLDAVKSVVDAHRPDPDYGLDESGRELRALRERLKAGKDLPARDLNTLLRAML